MCNKKTTSSCVVQYHQVDQMGIVHHAQYAYFLEQSRIEWLQHQGVSYAALEKDGILLPLTDISIQYKQPLRFEERFFVHVSLESLDGFFVTFSYRSNLLFLVWLEVCCSLTIESKSMAISVMF